MRGLHDRLTRAGRRLASAAMLASLLAMLAACATTTTIRDEARAHARDGDVEKALSTLDEGLKRHPDDPTLLAAAPT